MKKLTENLIDNEPLYMQLYKTLRSDILEGRLKKGDKLPSKRQLSNDIGVSQNTVLSAYSMLQSHGYIESHLRKGYFVSSSIPENDSTYIEEKEWNLHADQKYNFSANGNALFNSPAPYTKITHKMLNDINKRLFSYIETLGSDELRNSIASYLYTQKNIRCEASQIIIGSGFAYTLDVCIKTLGCDKVYAVESPSYGRAIRGFETNNCNIKYLNTFKDGFKINNLESSGADVLFCMSHHQYPLGYNMSDDFKNDLLDWANKGDRYIIEFDYDSDFLYRNTKSPTLLSLDNSEHVIQIGNFQRTIAPGISISYAVLPHKVKTDLKENMPFYNCLSSNIDMSLVNELIKYGNLQNNIKSLRKIYKAKHDFVLEIMNNLKSRKNIDIFGDTAGSYFCITYNGSKSVDELRTLLVKNNIKMMPLTAYCRKLNPNISEKTFVFGYGELDNQTLQEGIKKFDNVFN